MVPAIERTSSGFLFHDTLDANVRGADLDGYHAENWTVTAGYAVSLNATLYSLIAKLGVSPTLDMVLELDAWTNTLGTWTAFKPVIGWAGADITTYGPYFQGEDGHDSGGVKIQRLTRVNTDLSTTSISTRTPGAAVASSTWYSLKLSRAGSAFRLARGAEVLTGTDATLINTPPFGAGIILTSDGMGGSGEEHRVRNMALYKSTSILVKGLAAGYAYAQLVDRTGTQVAAATHSGGTATLDVSGTNFAPNGFAGTLRIWDSSSKNTMDSYLADTFWGGDSLTRVLQTTWYPGHVV